LDLVAVTTTARMFGVATAQGTVEQVQAAAARQGFNGVPTRRGDTVVITLTALDAADAPRRSISAVHGKGRQPLHTDGAHLPDPPDFVVLHSAGPSPTPTWLWGAGQSTPLTGGPDGLDHGIFLVGYGPSAFFSPARQFGRRVRFDPVCMVACDARAREAAAYLSAATEQGAVAHEWAGTDEILVIDNRRVLHGRGDATYDTERVLTRLAFRGPKALG
jgi:alpha-ketoglutarate-dependent taurine dioxygenase